MRYVIKLILLQSLLTVSSLNYAGTHDYHGKTSLCHDNEDIYFNCELENSGKMVSICAKNNASPDNGYVQYRIGTGRSVDFMFPDKLLSPRNKMSIITVSRFRTGMGDHIKFNNGPYTYVLSSALVPGEIYVVKNGKIVFDKSCKGINHIEVDNKAYSGIEKGVENAIDELDQH
jgi:hypothetical protein